MVVTAQYMATGMLVKPFAGPSTTYISVPITSTTINTNDRNTRILRRLACKAPVDLGEAVTTEINEGE